MTNLPSCTMTKWQLFRALESGRVEIAGKPYILLSVERESGSGRTYNLYVSSDDHKVYSSFCTTPD